MPDRTRNRSDGMQYLLLEISSDPFILGDLSSAQGLSYKLQPFQFNDQLLDLRDQLKKRLWELIETGLTDRQKQVIKLSVAGKTQNEIAKVLGINQTSVHKVLKGNIDYRNSRRRYGGAIKKIKRLCQLDEEIQSILTKMRELSEFLEL